MDNMQGKLRYKEMLKMIGDARGKTILDLGSGPNPISKRTNAKKVLIHDVNKEFTPSADVLADLNKEAIPLNNSSVDIIVAGEFIEHMLNPVKFVRDCCRVLKKNGKLVISTPNIASLKNRFKLLFGKMPEYCAMAKIDGEDSFQTHVKDFNLYFLKKILEENGFLISDVSSNGIIVRSQLVFPHILTPASFGEVLIVCAVKK